MEDRNNIRNSIPGMRRGPMARFAEVQHANDAKGTLKRISLYFKKEIKSLILILLVVMAETFCIIYAPVLQSKSIDIIEGSKYGNLLISVALMLAFYLFYCIFSLIQSLMSANLSQKITKTLREELFAKIIDLPVKYLDTHSHGDTMSRMTNDIENLSSSVAMALPTLCSGILTILGTAVVMLLLCWQLALLSFATIIITLVSSTLLTKKVRKYSRKRQALLGELNGTAEEMIAGYRTVVAFNRQDTTKKEFNETSDSLTLAGIKTDTFSGIMGPLMNCISNIGFVIIAAFGGIFSLKGLITVGIISAFLIYVKQFSRPVNEIAQIYGQIQTAIAGAERVFNVLDEETEPMQGEELNCNGNAKVEFRNINFSYIPGIKVINNFSLEIPSGKKVALVGSTGSGKTTIVNLLMRFYDPQEGTIFIDGKDISKISRNSLRKDVAIVLQDAVLFTDTVKNNLLFANPNADDSVLDNAIKNSHCDSFISKLPQKTETVLTGSGSNISQGQKQLITIARAFAADPKILILDEATSNVDTRTEKQIQNAMHRIMENRTSIIIAHRLSTIIDADLIVVMENGTIKEAGNHESLMAKHGKYYDLYKTQYAGFST